MQVKRKELLGFRIWFISSQKNKQDNELAMCMQL